MKKETKAIHVAWQKYKKWQADRIKNETKYKLKLIPGVKITSYNMFKEIYINQGRRLENVKYEVTHQVKKSGIKGFEERYRQLHPDQPFKTEYRGYSARQLYDLIQSDVATFEAQYKVNNPNATTKALRLAVSAYFYGS